MPKIDTETLDALIKELHIAHVSLCFVAGTLLANVEQSGYKADRIAHDISELTQLLKAMRGDFK